MCMCESVFVHVCVCVTEVRARFSAAGRGRTSPAALSQRHGARHSERPPSKWSTKHRRKKKKKKKIETHKKKTPHKATTPSLSINETYGALSLQGPQQPLTDMWSDSTQVWHLPFKELRDESEPFLQVISCCWPAQYVFSWLPPSCCYWLILVQWDWNFQFVSRYCICMLWIICLAYYRVAQ